jgi:CHAT domain-containing protein
MLGLARSFLHAGADQVVASLWMVRERATAELMKLFYSSYFKQKLGPSAALRAAQVAMLHQSRWRDPYFWAAFGLYGDWRGSNGP